MLTLTLKAQEFMQKFISQQFTEKCYNKLTLTTTATNNMPYFCKNIIIEFLNLKITATLYVKMT